MKELVQLFNASMKESAFHHYEESERLEMLFFQKAERLGMSLLETEELWNKMLMKQKVAAAAVPIIHLGFRTVKRPPQCSLPYSSSY